MRIRELTCMGLQAWPPQWLSACQTVDESAVLKDVKHILGTDLLRIDVEHNRIPYLGLMMVEEEIREILYRMLKENIGKQLKAIADLEVETAAQATTRSNRAKGNGAH